MKDFTKGQKVIHISLYNRNGAFTFTRAIVQSCGKKQMTLLNEKTGEMMGRNFCPLEGFKSVHHDIEAWAAKDNRPMHHVCQSGTFRDMSDEEAHALCLKLSAEWIAADLVRLERCKASSNHQAYINSIQRDIDILKAETPRAIQR